MPPLLSQAIATLPAGRVLPEVAEALAAKGAAVLAAPPGAGKTTLVPLHLLGAPWRADGRIILLEPRRLAARAAARRMADLLGENVGATVGYRMRLDTRVSAKTRVEVVTEGVFLRMVLDDPELTGVAAVVFDEFHERALDADLALALTLDLRAALRPDLRLLVMSATLDTARVAALLGEPPVISSQGRAFPVDIRYRERTGRERVEDAVAQAIRQALFEETGSILAFLPGQAEIRRTAERLEDRLPADVLLAPLFGMMDGEAQDRAIRPAAAGQRKIVLATAIAESSITIDGVRIVIDGGLQRLPHFEPGTGITRLETVRVSRASADQRAGRAGRTEPGIAIRLWREEQTAALPAFTPPEILSSDLSGLILDCAAWGVNDPATLAFIDAPPPPALAEARALLDTLGALDPRGGLTATGQTMRTLGLPARLAAMVVKAEPCDRLKAAELAVLLTEQGLGGRSVDLAERHRRMRFDKDRRSSAARDLAARAARDAGGAKGQPVRSAGALLALGYPDRIARRRGARGRYLMASGRGAELDEHDPLASEEWLTVAELTGRAGAHQVLAAATIEPAEVDAVIAALGQEGEECFFDLESRSVRARRVRRLGLIVVDETPLPLTDNASVAATLAEGVRRAGLLALPWTKEAKQLRARLAFLHRTLGAPWPDVSDNALLASLDIWFSPFQPGVRAFDAIAPASLRDGLMALLPHDRHRRLDQEAPTHFEVPTGSRIAIAYDGEEPRLAVRVQELFGLKTHPSIAEGRLPLLLELLSPAQRPIQTTRDLPGFWSGSWSDVRAEMRGRYPRHPWPEDPAAAQPTRRAKPRGM
ncbi:ATP-dependent helicase HrpB [Pararhizobium haloflavum]|uniref:ATP-dependent helicase HrpB n=1 Tax=Pararhizobium haloflavum TaxID=2037914 RepID=UPI000C176860|nr:ATP-dependent helicase HrpB [Pararhizobium haloflavum]